MKNPISIELLKDCPIESFQDHQTIATAIERGESRETILNMAEVNRWPATYVWLKGELPKNPAAVSLGRKGGSAKTPAKAAASAANGAKGGRPAKSNEFKIHLNSEAGAVEATEIRYAARLSGARQSARRALNKWAMEAIIFQRIGEDDAGNTGYERIEILK